MTSGWRPSTADILDLNGVPRRFDDFRFELVDTRNRPLGELHPDLDRNPTVTWDSTRDVHGSLDGFYISSDEMDDVNTSTDRVRVWMHLQNGVRYSLGVFLWADSSLPLRPWGYERQGTLLDKTYILESFEIVNGLSLPRKELPLSWVMRSLRTFPEFRQDTRIDPDWSDDPEAKAVLWILVALGEEAASKELGAPVNWQPGASLLSVYNDVMGLCGYLPVHANQNGTIILHNAPDIQRAPATLSYDIESGRMIEGSISRADDKLSAVDRVVVYDSSANSSPIRGEWNAPSSSPYSAAARGWSKSKVVSRTGLSNRAEANREAKRIGELLIKAGNWIEWQSPADPRHVPYNILNVLGERWVEVSRKIGCRAGDPMSHRALKIYADEEAAL